MVYHCRPPSGMGGSKGFLIFLCSFWQPKHFPEILFALLSLGVCQMLISELPVFQWKWEGGRQTPVLLTGPQFSLKQAIVRSCKIMRLLLCSYSGERFAPKMWKLSCLVFTTLLQ